MQTNRAVRQYRKPKNVPVISVTDDHLFSQNLYAKFLMRHCDDQVVPPQAETAAFGYPRERSCEQRAKRPLAIRDMRRL